MPIIHVMFEPGTAASLRRALAQLERHDLVVHLSDNFSFGPIDDDPAGRVQWVDETLGITNWHSISVHNEPFLAAACSPHLTPVAWFSRRDAQSYAGFLWWLSHLGDAPCRVVDVTDLRIAYKGHPPFLVVSPSLLPADQMFELIDGHEPLEGARREEEQAQWRALAADDGALRVISASGALVSAPISHFDALLLSCASIGWRKMSMMIQQALAASRGGDISQTGDLLIHSRLCALAEEGTLEWRGDLNSMHKCELRLPAGGR